ncbi:MAG: ABC transporter ATP-binding protein [Firmicutes bacterium]|nr:ABC transporter ATP-binding protein [Bacillota bacterium]
MTKPLLEIKELRTSFFTDDGIMPSVDGASLTVNEGEVVGLVGESGCGKTVMSLSVIRMIAHPGKIVSGEILFKGENLIEYSEEQMRKIRGSGIGMIFQDPLTSLNPVFNIADLMATPLMLHKKIDRKQAMALAVEMLAKVGIASPEKRIMEYPHQFSGGQRQRISIATALALNPSLLIADEPTTALDVSIQAQILDLLTGLQKELNTSMIFISHNLGVISGISHKVAVMYGGWIVEEAPVKELFTNPCHPYTKALLEAIPTIEGGDRRLKNLPGQPPTVGEVIPGCRFSSRCPDMIKGVCDTSPPADFITGEKHRVRCHLFVN